MNVITKINITLIIVKIGSILGEKISPPKLELPIEETEKSKTVEVIIPKKDAKKL